MGSGEHDHRRTGCSLPWQTCGGFARAPRQLCVCRLRTDLAQDCGFVERAACLDEIYRPWTALCCGEMSLVRSRRGCCVECLALAPRLSCP